MGAQGLLWGVVVLALVGVTSPTRTIMAINAGGDTTIAADGEVFERDRYYQGGVVSKKGKDLFINGTNSPALYQTERFAIGEELWYSLPIPFNVGHNGRGWTFVLTLKFVEVQFNATGRRMFGVNLNGLHVLRDIDVFSMVGWATAYDEHIEFRIDPDHYAIWVTSVGPMRVRIEQPAAFYGDLHVALTPTEFGNARLCAMQLTQGTLEELDAAAEQADPSRRQLSSKKMKSGGDNKSFGPRALLLVGALAAAMFLARELFGWNFKKRGLPAKLRGKSGSQPGGRRAKSERETPPRSQKKMERSSSSDGNPDQSANKSPGKGSSKASPENKQKSEPKVRPESPHSQAKREERSRQKKEQRDKQKEKSRQESMRAEAEALAKAKAAAQSAARRSAAALAALEEATAAEAAAEAEALREKAEAAAARREAAKEAELAAREEAKQAKINLKRRARKAAAKIKPANPGETGSPAHLQQAAKQQATKQKQKHKQPPQQQQQRSNDMTSDSTSKGGSTLPSPGSSGSLSSLPDTFQPTFEPHGLGIDWSHTDGGGALNNTVSRLSTGSNSSFGSDDMGPLDVGTDNGDLDIDVFAMLQDEIMSRDLGLDVGSADGSGKGTLDESRLLSNLVDFLDTDESDSESLADSSYSGDDFFGPFDSGAAGNQLSASAPEFTPTGPAEGHQEQGDVSSLSVEVWMEAHDLSQYTSNLLDAGLKTVGDLLAMPLTHDHLKSLGLTKLRGRLLLMNSLKSNRQRRGE